MGENEETCTYCAGVGACPKCWGREALNEAAVRAGHDYEELVLLTARLAEAEGAVDQLTAELNRATREMERERYKHLRILARILASVPGRSVLITDHTEITLPDDVEIQSWEDMVQRGTVVRLVMRGEEGK